MLFQINRILLTILGCLILLSITDKQHILKAGEIYSKSDTKEITESNRRIGYRDVVLFKDNYIAVGTDGRIDCFSKSGKNVSIYNTVNADLNCAYSYSEILVAAGDHGTIQYTSDGKIFYPAESPTQENINGITSRDGLILACADNGTILISNDGKAWSLIQTNAKGNIMSLSATSSFFMGVTNVGEIIKSTDGKNWEIKDYNKEYAGYNEPARFKKIIATPNTIAIIGTHDDGSPSILLSTLGNVWAERIPLYHDEQGTINYLTKKPNGITYNSVMDEFILACDNGELFSLPSCSKCNKYLKISDGNLQAVLYNDDCLVIVGDEYFFYTMKL